MPCISLSPKLALEVHQSLKHRKYSFQTLTYHRTKVWRKQSRSSTSKMNLRTHYFVALLLGPRFQRCFSARQKAPSWPAVSSKILALLICSFPSRSPSPSICRQILPALLRRSWLPQSLESLRIPNKCYSATSCPWFWNLTTRSNRRSSTEQTWLLLGQQVPMSLTWTQLLAPLPSWQSSNCDHDQISSL